MGMCMGATLGSGLVKAHLHCNPRHAIAISRCVVLCWGPLCRDALQCRGQFGGWGGRSGAKGARLFLHIKSPTQLALWLPPAILVQPSFNFTVDLQGDTSIQSRATGEVGCPFAAAVFAIDSTNSMEGLPKGHAGHGKQDVVAAYL